MALEVRVYREVTAYQAKVVMGMSWRQLACAAVALVVLGPIYAAGLWMGHEDAATWVIAVLAMPIGAVGWVRPKGLPFEKYAAYVWAHKMRPQRLEYAQAPVWSVDRAMEEWNAQKLSRKQKRKVAALEAQG